jgi:hypothetical protein
LSRRSCCFEAQQNRWPYLAPASVDVERVPAVGRVVEADLVAKQRPRANSGIATSGVKRQCSKTEGAVVRAVVRVKRSIAGGRVIQAGRVIVEGISAETRIPKAGGQKRQDPSAIRCSRQAERLRGLSFALSPVAQDSQAQTGRRIVELLC